MKIEILECIEGAKKAGGLTVIIDVFRAFSLEAYLFSKGALRIIPVGQLESAFALKKEHPDWPLFGERKGAQVEGCDFGNSPSQIKDLDFTAKTCIHTTSAGTQGIVNATKADAIITGSLVNAAAIARYIEAKNPEQVSLVAMGNQGVSRADEDVLCARYIKSLLEHSDFDLASGIEALKETDGKKFLDPNNLIFPRDDFFFATQVNQFDFVIEVKDDGNQKVFC